MAISQPNYQVRTTFEGELSLQELWYVLNNIPLKVKISDGHNIPLTERLEDEPFDEPILLVDHAAKIISLRPSPGKRLSDASFFGDRAAAFVPSRVMDELTGGGACCSYSFNTKGLNMPIDYNLVLEIYKLG